MRKANTVDQMPSLTATIPQTGVASLAEKASEPSVSSAEIALTVCVVCCSTASMPHDAPLIVARAMGSVAGMRTILLSETGSEQLGGVEVIAVPCGTKLSKIRRLADLMTADLFCICDPDITIEETACRIVLQQAMVDVRAGKEVIAFGIVEGRDDGTLLSRVVAVDKWLSHRVLRRFLLSAGIGLTLPGQFLFLSPGLLRNIAPDVDTFLDDLYLGWIAWQRCVRVHRVPVVVGKEDPRNSWLSLLTQRIRWMNGLICLGWLLSSNLVAVVLLLMHYMVYHGLPILIGLGIWWLAITNPPAATTLFIVLAAALAWFTRQSLLTACCYLAVFPCLHLVVSLFWWLPLGKSLLRR